MNICEVTPEMKEGWANWVKSKPEGVRALIEKKGLTPWKLYLLKTSGHRVTLYSVDEGNGDSLTLKVTVSGRFNLVTFERTVFGIDPNDLEECDLPAKDEPRGAALTGEEVYTTIDGVAPGEPRFNALKEAASKALDDMTKSTRKA